MITKEQFERFKKFYAYMRPLVSQKMKEKYEIEYGKPFPKDEQIVSVEYDIEEDCFCIKTERYGSYSCHDTEYYSVKPMFIYDENAMDRFKKEIEAKKMQDALIKQKQEEKIKEQHEKAEKEKLVELSKKYGYTLTVVD